MRGPKRFGPDPRLPRRGRRGPPDLLQKPSRSSRHSTEESGLEGSTLREEIGDSTLQVVLYPSLLSVVGSTGVRRRGRTSSPIPRLCQCLEISFISFVSLGRFKLKILGKVSGGPTNGVNRL